MKSLIFVAPPAAGKGTQAKIFSDLYNLEHISTGDLLRVEAETNESIKAKMAAGEFISDDIIINLIKNKISNLGSSNGYILDGFPRNLSQAKAFDEMLISSNQKVDYVIYIDVDKEVAKNRITGRLYCPNCGATYNEFIEANMPIEANVCDRCKSSLIKRQDDNAVTFENRFEKYMELTLPLLSYYEEKGNLYRVNGNQDSNNVTSEIKNIIDNK